MNCHYCPLEQESLLHIIGPDTRTFLQGQTSCDTRMVNTSHALPGIFCTPQGRVICDFLLCELGPDHFALRLRRDIRASSSAAFGKYIIFSKAQLDDRREDWIPLAIWGTESASMLGELCREVPSERFGATSGNGFVLLQTDEGGEQFELYLDSTASEGHLAHIEKIMQLGTESEWQSLQITQGVARIEAATVEEFVPQVLNYDLTGHISFTKGCYTGQEVVARLHYLGKSKRRTYLAQLVGEKNCVAGTALYSTGSSQSVGTVINCSTTEGTTLILAVATINGATNGLHLGTPDGPLLTLGELPYSLETD